MSRAHREVYTKGTPKLDHLAPDRLDLCPKLHALELWRLSSRGNRSGAGPIWRPARKGIFKALSRRPMASDWSQCAAVESVPGKQGGAWVSHGTRMPVAAVFENS